MFCNKYGSSSTLFPFSSWIVFASPSVKNLFHIDDYYKFNAKDRPDFSQVDLIISKNRSGSQGTVNLVFERPYTNFKNCLKSEENEDE